MRYLAPVLLLLAACAEESPRSTTLALGERLDAIHYVDDAGASRTRAIDAADAATVIWFWSVKCACVRDCEERIIKLLERYKGKGVRFVAVDSNPGDSRAEIEKLREQLGSPYAVLRDDNGRTMTRTGVNASASVAVLDGEGKLRFRGAIDDDRYRPTLSYVHRAVDAILAGETFEPTTATPYGCLYPLPEQP